MEDPQVSDSAAWRDLHRRLCTQVAPIPPAVRLIRLHVVDVPDVWDCSLDGAVWGVLRTERRAPRRVRGSPVVVRMFRQSPGQCEPRRDGPVGSGFDEFVFLHAESYDVARGTS